MAETAAAGLINVIFEKLANKALEKYVRSHGLQPELNELGSKLSQIQALLNDASHKEVTDESVGIWLNSLQHVAYDIDDVLDDVATEAMRRELIQESGAITSKVRRVIPTCCKNISLSHRLHLKLDSINAKLQHLEKQKSDLGLIVKDERQKNTSRGNETCLLESDVVGREGEKEKLLNKLLGDDESSSSSKEKFSVVPIVGMGGVGKTTLARILYNDTKVKDHFELHAWVCVSDDSDIFRISKTLLQVVSREKQELEDLNQLQMALTEQFKYKRFLLVLDDVWTENYDEWENLVRPLHVGALGSRIIMTTRKEQLLKMIGFDHLDHLESLSGNDALSLFALHALGVDNFDSHPTLKRKGECIVEKCGGLPLALKAIGRLLRTKSDEEKWDDVLNSKLWDLKNIGDLCADRKTIIPALRLSYHDLSSNLKQLFAYCSLFPKDFMFVKEQLVLLWMAEGFLNRSNTSKSLERLGHEYFEELLLRSFFQPAPNGESLFVMHDLMNDLATFVRGDFFLRFDNNVELGTEALAKYRHMSFIRESCVGYQKFEVLKRARSLRTFMAVSVELDQRWSFFNLSSRNLFDLLPQLPLLRVLSLSHFQIREVPAFIGSLKHLRYLNLSRTEITELPENVGNLYNLQTLIIFGCERLTKLPKSFLKLKKLRHFDIRDTPLLEKLPLGIGELKCLQTFTKIIIEGDKGFAIDKLKGLENLQGEISIEGLHKVQSAMHAREANLSLKKLTKLQLKWDDGSRLGTLEMEVLNELKPNSDSLKELVIVSYGGTSFPNWVGDLCYHHLVRVSICRCRKCTSLPPLGQLPSLKEICIQGMDAIKVIGLELTGTTVVAFPSLEILVFEDMCGWEVWLANSDVLDVVFPYLKELHIINCPKLIDVSLQALPLLKVLELRQCGDGVLRSLAQAAPSITMLDISCISGLTYEVWRGVVDYLGALEEVEICGFDEMRYLWESEERASKYLVNLKKLTIKWCHKLLTLGEKKDDSFGSNLLSSLKMFNVQHCGSLEHLCCPDSIESLSIGGCESLTRVSFPTATDGGQRLKSLYISNCKKLMEKIDNASEWTMLETVCICEWTNLKSIIQLSNSIHLTELVICNCESLESFPDLQLSNLTLLKRLTITNCPSVDVSFPRGVWPLNLNRLEIGGLKKPISEWGPQNFPTSLLRLRLINEHVSSFRQLSDLLPSSLPSLRIIDFDKLESLSTGLQHLTSLQHLSILNCPKMKHLPKTLLPSLLSLTIFKCPNLMEKCTGRCSHHYWPLIYHIPDINIHAFDRSERVKRVCFF